MLDKIFSYNAIFFKKLLRFPIALLAALSFSIAMQRHPDEGLLGFCVTLFFADLFFQIGKKIGLGGSRALWGALGLVFLFFVKNGFGLWPVFFYQVDLVRELFFVVALFLAVATWPFLLKGTKQELEAYGFQKKMVFAACMGGIIPTLLGALMLYLHTASYKAAGILFSLMPWVLFLFWMPDRLVTISPKKSSAALVCILSIFALLVTAASIYGLFHVGGVVREGIVLGFVLLLLAGFVVYWWAYPLRLESKVCKIYCAFFLKISPLASVGGIALVAQAGWQSKLWEEWQYVCMLICFWMIALGLIALAQKEVRPTVGGAILAGAFFFIAVFPVQPIVIEKMHLNRLTEIIHSGKAQEEKAQQEMKRICWRFLRWKRLSAIKHLESELPNFPVKVDYDDPTQVVFFRNLVRAS